MSTDVKIEGLAGRIEISVHDYDNADAQHPSDANWLHCGVTLAIGTMSMTFDASFTTHDFFQLQSQLAVCLKALQGAAVFETDEEALRFRIEFGRRGDATIAGTARSVEQARAKVDFTFDSDQTFLQRALSDLRDVCAAFPIKGSVAPSG